MQSLLVGGAEDDWYLVACPRGDQNRVSVDLLRRNQVPAEKIFVVSPRKTEPPADVMHTAEVDVRSSDGIPRPGGFRAGWDFYVSSRSALRAVSAWHGESPEVLVLGNPRWWLDRALSRRYDWQKAALEDGLLPYISGYGLSGSRVRRRVGRWRRRPWLTLVTGSGDPTIDKAFRSFPATPDESPIPWSRLNDLDLPTSTQMRKGSTVFLSQSISEDGYVSRSEELDLVRLCFSAQREGHRHVYVKPHPRDDEEKVRNIERIATEYGFEVELFPFGRDPIEFHFSQLNQDGIGLVGHWSASLFYYSLLGGPRPVSTLALLAKTSRFYAGVLFDLRSRGLMSLVRLLSPPS